jgi:hypothetical protein
MCDVHLIEHSRLPVKWKGQCSLCGSRINGNCIEIRGHLDDGTPGIQVLRYHLDCIGDVDDSDPNEHDGCRWYGTISETIADKEGS